MDRLIWADIKKKVQLCVDRKTITNIECINFIENVDVYAILSIKHYFFNALTFARSLENKCLILY